ncbi:hypothetical protein [Corynebacterium sp. Marseille-P4321]|uniref:hypothetical protein n=1 Tax=Corynebacterium sp. Marseille-P4321 TaxID=2736603 RepID=UPI001041BDC6|nr:hypothetical protein [Corynebacterium sp. Marseille-P4321]
MPQHNRRFTALALACACTLSLAGCGLVDATLNHQLALQDALEKSSGQDAVTLPVDDLYPAAEKVVLVCPYSGAAANDLLGHEAFKGYEDVDEGANWVAVKETNGATIKVAIDRTQIDLCAESAIAAEDVTGGSLEFEQRGGTWFFTGM